MEKLEGFLKEREVKGLLRVLQPANLRDKGSIYFKDEKYIDFSSNDYLGLSDHPRLKEASRKAADKFGTSSSASRLLSGDLDIHHELEEEIAVFKSKERGLIFNSGYQANIGIISSLCGKNDVIFSDKLNHASILDGMLLSGAMFFRFRHNDPEHLEVLLKRERNKFKEALIITETIFSMDGDKAPLKELVCLKEEHNCRIMVDEAHATGVFGEGGSGIIEQENLAKEVDLIMGTFSKALGGFGAYLASSKRVVDYLINSCRSFIYSTALPPPVIAANLESLNLIKNEPQRREGLLENAEYFRNELRKRKLNVRGSSQIVPLVVGNSKKAVKLSEELKKRRYWALPIRPPTVPIKEARVRFSLTYYHSKRILEKLIDDICGIECI